MQRSLRTSGRDHRQDLVAVEAAGVRGRAIRVAGTPERSAVVEKVCELLELGRRYGYRRDELVALVEQLGGAST